MACQCPRIGALALALLGLAAVPTPPAVAAGDGSLTLLPGTAGCLSAPTWRYKPGCTRIRGLRKPSDVSVSPDGRNVYVTSGSGSPSRTELPAYYALAVYKRAR